MKKYVNLLMILLLALGFGTSFANSVSADDENEDDAKIEQTAVPMQVRDLSPLDIKLGERRDEREKIEIELQEKQDVLRMEIQKQGEDANEQREEMQTEMRTMMGETDEDVETVNPEKAQQDDEVMHQKMEEVRDVLKDLSLIHI